MTDGFKTAALALGMLMQPVAVALAAEPEPQQARPNIVFILSDDQRADMLSCAGNAYAQTPHLDRLAAEGIRFDRAFVTTGVCMPSRASYFTGKQAHNAGAPTIIHMPHTFHHNQPTFPARLHEAGYHTAHFGKWHLGAGEERQAGFDHWAGYPASSSFHDPTITTNGRAKEYEGFTDFIISDMASEHIARVAKRDQPFFISVGIAAPHAPFEYPARYSNLFADVDIPKPVSFAEDFSKTGKAQFMQDLLDVTKYHNGLPRFKTWENYVKSYYRSSQSIDESVGMILAALDKAGAAKNTMVIYTSDHGYFLGEHGLTEKLYSYEPVMRVPMLVRYPQGAVPGSVRRELVCNLDVAPTCLALAGVGIPADIEGRSLLPLVAAGGGPVSDWRSDVFYFLEGGHMSVRTERYKYITYPVKPGEGSRPRAAEDEPPELYDLETDPDEMVNLIGDPKYAAVLADMTARLAAHVEATGLTPRVDLPVISAWLLGPIPADQEAVIAKQAFAGDVNAGVAVTVNGRTYTWTRVRADKKDKFPIAKLVDGDKDAHFLLAFRIEVLTERDPFVRVVLQKKGAPVRGWVDGKLLYDRRADAPRTETQFNWRFNPPLVSGMNTLIFAGRAEDFPSSRVYVQSWEGKTRLLP